MPRNIQNVMTTLSKDKYSESDTRDGNVLMSNTTLVVNSFIKSYITRYLCYHGTDDIAHTKDTNLNTKKHS